ncbi:hypothetical protein HDU76_014081, partial [Blyttiomyces sp. JEL0837]
MITATIQRVTSQNLTWTHPPRTSGKIKVPASRTSTTATTDNTTTNNLIDIYYELHGNGPKKVLLVAGWGNSCRAWVTSLNYFKAMKDQYEVCVFDNRGVGDSDQNGKGFTVKDMALDALDLLRFLGWEKDVLLVGVSMGGMISMELIMAAPKDTFAAAALVSTRAGWSIPT